MSLGKAFLQKMNTFIISNTNFFSWIFRRSWRWWRTTRPLAPLKIPTLEMSANQGFNQQRRNPKASDSSSSKPTWRSASDVQHLHHPVLTFSIFIIQTFLPSFQADPHAWAPLPSHVGFYETFRHPHSFFFYCELVFRFIAIIKLVPSLFLWTFVVNNTISANNQNGENKRFLMWTRHNVGVCFYFIWTVTIRNKK